MGAVSAFTVGNYSTNLRSQLRYISETLCFYSKFYIVIKRNKCDSYNIAKSLKVRPVFDSYYV